MFDYSDQIEAFRAAKVRLPQKLLEKLYGHRDANRDRLIHRLPQVISDLSISEGSFKPQGSTANRTVIQTKFLEEEYDLDDGLVLWKDELVDPDGVELTHTQVRELVRDALQDDRFVKQPELHTNCVRVFYADTEDEKHHVDFPIYRKWIDENGETVRELAGSDGWTRSDPTQVNKWFADDIAVKNNQCDGFGTQMRHLNQLLKRFCRSRSAWDLPNGMKLMMLIHECQPPYNKRIDVAFRGLLDNLRSRLAWNKVIRNLAHPELLALTRSTEDANVVSLYEKIGEARQELSKLDLSENNNIDAATKVWDWIFQSDGYLAELTLESRAAAINNRSAWTSPLGIICSSGIANKPHRFYGA